MPPPKAERPSLLARFWKPLVVLLYALGLAWVLAYPLACISCGETKCRGTYFSENALLANAAHAVFRPIDGVYARGAQRRFSSAVAEAAPPHTSHESAAVSWLVEELRAAGLETKTHRFRYARGPCAGREGVNVYGILRASRGDGREAIVLTAPYVGSFVSAPTTSTHPPPLPQDIAQGKGAPSGMILLLAVARLLKEQAWLAKDVILLMSPGHVHAHAHMHMHGAVTTPTGAAPPASSCAPPIAARGGDHNGNRTTTPPAPWRSWGEGVAPGVEAWVRDYHTARANTDTGELSVAWAGALRGALVLDIPASAKGGAVYDGFAALLQGTNGNLPNLDLFNLLRKVAPFPLRLSRHDHTDSLARAARWAHRTRTGRTIRSDHDRAQLATAYEGMLASTARFMSGLIFGPAGPHAHFIRYNVDALTLAALPRSAVGVPSSALAQDQGGHHDRRGRQGTTTSLHDLGVALSQTIRSLSNIEEALHQSYYLYLLPSTRHFVSIGEYSYALGLVGAPLIAHLIAAAASPVVASMSFGLAALVVVEMVGAAALFLLPRVPESFRTWHILVAVAAAASAVCWFLLVLLRRWHRDSAGDSGGAGGSGERAGTKARLRLLARAEAKAVLIVLLLFFGLSHAALGILSFATALTASILAVPLLCGCAVYHDCSNHKAAAGESSSSGGGGMRCTAAKVFLLAACAGFTPAALLVVLGLAGSPASAEDAVAWAVVTWQQVGGIVAPYVCFVLLPVPVLAAWVVAWV